MVHQPAKSDEKEITNGFLVNSGNFWMTTTMKITAYSVHVSQLITCHLCHFCHLCWLFFTEWPILHAHVWPWWFLVGCLHGLLDNFTLMLDLFLIQVESLVSPRVQNPHCLPLIKMKTGVLLNALCLLLSGREILLFWCCEFIQLYLRISVF